uniref:Hypothetical chloroplast RF1 n=1 Tax=Oedocladium carolinianum TaxID=55992 RepID=A0A8K1MXC8_9CHLO|nr:hypothetical chloroplast RF1 [Oedocladium carolinianum]
MSLVTVIKDYIEIVHKIIETSPAYIVQHTNYTDVTTLYFYLINTVKHVFTDIFSLEFFQKIAAFPIIVPSIADSMISEISVLDGTFHNVFTFLDAPLEKVFSTKNDFIVIICLEKFFIGLLNSLFLWLPTSAATFLCLRRFVMQGMEIGYIAAIGTMTANIFWLICVLFGVRWIVIPWMSLDILRYWLGFMLLIKYFWDNRLPAKEIKSDFSVNVIKTKLGLNSIIAIFAQIFKFNRNFSNPIQQIFLFHFLLALTEQTSLYPFLSHFSLSAQSTYLESFPSDNLINFILIHCFYLLGIFIGSFSFINFLCWFWEEPAYKVYLWATKNFQKIRAGDMVRITHFIFQTLTISLACASLPYFSIEYFITKPLGFLPNDQIFHQSKNNAFLTHSTSPVLYRSPYYFPRQRFFRYDDWAEYYGKNIPLDTSLYDQGAYRLYPIEDLHYGADYEWTRRRSNHVKIRSRMKRIMWFPRNWATQIWDLAKTWSRRNVAWRNEILSQYQNNWDSKSAPFWDQIIREELLFEKGKLYFQNERKSNSPWVSSQNWSQKFLTSGEGFWWNWWTKNTISDNKIWWNWILTKKNKIVIDHNNQLTFSSTDRSTKNMNQLKFIHIDQKNNENVKREMLFSNYQKLPTSYRLDYWLPQERLISLYSEQSQRQKNQLNFEIATLRKFVRKINKRIQINATTSRFAPPLSKYTIFSIKNSELYYKKYLFSNSLRSLINNFQNLFYLNQNSLLNSQKHKVPLLFSDMIDSNKILNSLGKSLKVNHIQKTIPNPNFSKNANFNNSTSLFLTLPAQYYLHKEQSFSRKLQFYGVRTSRQFKPLNNSPIFNFYMKTYFHQYKPTRLYIANTKMKRDLGAGGRNRFKSRQYANKQLKKARILSKTPWIRQWISQSGFLTRRKRLESWIRYSHYNSNEIWAFIMKADIDNFIKRQPSNHLLTNNEERLLHLRRFLLGEHYETLRWYSYMQHYRSMKTKIGGTKSFANRMYNQQFKGTFHKVRHLFALTPSLNGGGMLTFDQPLYNEFSNDNQNSIFNKELIHEELLEDMKTNINSLTKNDLIMKSSQIIKEYILDITPIRQKIIHKLLKDKNYVDLTNFLWDLKRIKKQKTPILLPTTNQELKALNWPKGNFPLSKKQKDLKIDFKLNSLRSSFSIDQQRKFQSILIFMFNRRRALAKDYKRGSERLWKKWRKKYLIQKQISNQKNDFAKRELRKRKEESSFYTNKKNLEVSDNLNFSTDRRFIPLISATGANSFKGGAKRLIIDFKQNQALPTFRITDQIQKTPIYDKNALENKEEKIFIRNLSIYRYRIQTAIRKALKDSISIQKFIFNTNGLSKDGTIRNFGFSLNNNFDTKLEKVASQELIHLNKGFSDSFYTKWNIEKVVHFKKDNFNSELLRADKIAIKELIDQIYKKSKLFDKIQLKYFTLSYWFKNLINVSQYKWNILNFNKDENNKLLNDKKNQEELFNLLSYIQNRTIRERLEINKKILTITNYNQIDNKFSTIRASRHLKRARISQRKKLSQPIQKYKNFFHVETENIKQFNPFRIYQTLDSFNQLTPDFRRKLSKMTKSRFARANSFESLLNSSSFFVKNPTISDKINNLIESHKMDLINKNQINSFLFNDVPHANNFDIFQPFLESLYYLPRLSTLWQSNLINSNSNLKSKIDMGSIYETKQNWTPIGTHKELFRQNFNTKNKIQDNIKRKLLDNHLNRFSERRRWNTQYENINLEINEQLKKFLEIIKQNQNSVFNSQNVFDFDRIVFNSKETVKPMEIYYDKKSFPISKNQKPDFFSLDLQKNIKSLNIKDTDKPKLLSVIINQKNKSKFNIQNIPNIAALDNIQPNNFSFWDSSFFKNSFLKKSSKFLSNGNREAIKLNNFYYSKIKELIMNEHFKSDFDNQSISNFNKEFFYDKVPLLFSDMIDSNKMEKNQKKKFLKIINHLRTNTSINKINNNSVKRRIPQNAIISSFSIDLSVEKYLIKNFQQKIEKQLQKLENRLIELSEITKDDFKNKQNNDSSSAKLKNPESKIEFTLQKKLITKRIEFLTNLSEKLKGFEILYQTLPIDWKTNQMKIVNKSLRGRANSFKPFKGFSYFGLKNIKKQYYFSRKFLNLFVENGNNFTQYLNLKKEDSSRREPQSDLKKQNKIFFDLLQFELSPSSKNQIKEERKKLKIIYPIKNTLELTTNLQIQELLKKHIKQLNNSVLEKNGKFLKSQKIASLLPLKDFIPLSVDSSIIQLLVKKQKFYQFDEILGSLLAIQKRGNVLSQKNIYYKKLKHEWNKTKSSLSGGVYSIKKGGAVLKRFNSQFFRSLPSSKKDATRSGIENFIAIRTWTRSQQRLQNTPVNQKLLQHKNSVISDSLNSASFDKKIIHQNFLSVENFIKESILKPQRFEKQQSRKRLKFKKLPRQEHFKNLQIWENSLKQKEDVKNKQFFDDFSQSFQKWKSFGFFPQKIIFQKQILNSTALLPFLTFKEKNLKFQNFYDNNLQTITNLDIIKQIESDHLIQKELDFFLNQNSNLNQTSKNVLKNKQSLQIGNKEKVASRELIHLNNAFSEEIQIRNFASFDQMNLKNNQEQINYGDSSPDIISKIYEKFFVKSIETTIDESQINQKILIGINTFPFYAGWDESLRKFVITNRLLSRRDAGYQTNSNILFKEKENNLNIEFTHWPLQGRNAATTFFCHFPFINKPSDFSETIQYRNQTQLQQEEVETLAKRYTGEIQKKKFANSNKFLEKNQKFSIKRIKKQKQELRNSAMLQRRNITNIVAPNDIQNRRKALFSPLKWKSLKSNTKKIILKLPLNELQTSIKKDFSTINSLSNFSILKEKDNNYLKPLLSKFHLLRILRKGNTGKIRLPKLRPYKKYIKKENDILESSWRTFLSKRKQRSYNFVRQKNIRTMHLFKVQLGEKLKLTKMQWLFRKNNSRANRQSENRKNKSGTHYLRPRKKSLRRRSLGIRYQQNQKIWSPSLFKRYTASLSQNYWNFMMKQNKNHLSQKNEISTNQNSIILTKKILSISDFSHFLTDLSNLTVSKSDIMKAATPSPSKSSKQSKMLFYETPYNWIQPNNSSNLYNSLFKTSPLYTPTLYSILPGHGRFIPKIQTMPFPKSSVQTIKRAIRLANFEPASFIQREVLSYEWSMKQLIQNMTHRLNKSNNQLILKYRKNNLKQNFIQQNNKSHSSFSIDLLIQRHLRLFKKKLIHNPIISPSSNAYLSQFSRQRSFQKRSVRLRKFNMTLAMNLYDRWFFYYYTGGREDPLQNFFQSFEKLAQNISSPNNIQNIQSNQSNIVDDSKVTIDNVENFKNNFIFKSARKFLTQKPDQKRSFNTFLTNLKTKKSSQTLSGAVYSVENEQQNSVNSQKVQMDSLKNENSLSYQSSIDEKFDPSGAVYNEFGWNFFQLFPQTVDGRSAQKEMLDKLSSNKVQKKQQEKDLEEDRFYFLKANKSPIIQDFRSSKNVNRHHPLNGGFIWPGDYLRLQTIMLPKDKKNKYFYNKSLFSEMKNSAKLNNKNLHTSKSIIDSNSKINEKIQEFQNFILESK